MVTARDKEKMLKSIVTFIDLKTLEQEKIMALRPFLHSVKSKKL